MSYKEDGVPFQTINAAKNILSQWCSYTNYSDFIDYIHSDKVEDTDEFLKQFEKFIAGGRRKEDVELYNKFCGYCINQDRPLLYPELGLKLLNLQDYKDIKDNTLTSFIALLNAFKTRRDELGMLSLFLRYDKEDIVKGFENSKYHKYPSILDEFEEHGLEHYMNNKDKEFVPVRCCNLVANHAVYKKDYDLLNEVVDKVLDQYEQGYASDQELNDFTRKYFKYMSDENAYDYLDLYFRTNAFKDDEIGLMMFQRKQFLKELENNKQISKKTTNSR